MSDTPITAQDAASILNAWGQMKEAALWAAVAVGGLVLIYFCLRAYFAHKAEERIEARKEQRQRAYLAEIKGLRSDMGKHMDNDLEAMEKVSVALREVSSVCASISDKQLGRLELDPSLRMVEVYFSSIGVQAGSVVARSLWENDYENRKFVVASKIKTALARLVDDALAALSDFDLAFDPHSFFRTYDDPSTGGTRYKLCDCIWEAVEPLFQRHDEDLGPRLEEMRVTLSNAVRDQYSLTARRVAERSKRRDLRSEDDTPSGPYPQVPTK